MIDHDSLFKKLIQNFFPEFIELFFPDISSVLDKDSITFLPQEILTDLRKGDKKIVDILVQAKYQNEETLFIIHIEHQSYIPKDLGERMFCYYADLYKLNGVPILPIIIFSHDVPMTKQPSSFNISVRGKSVIQFDYEVVQLNQLNWQDFANIQNPVASALMSKMQMDANERPTVKLVSLQLLASLGLNQALVNQISVFIDTYLKLNTEEEEMFNQQIATIEPKQKEQVMEIVTSWMEKGIEKGKEEGIQIGRQLGREEGREEGTELGRQLGKQEHAASVALFLLESRLGNLSQGQRERIQGLSTQRLDDLIKAHLNFNSITDLKNWLARV
ncbi:hypothetical protein DSM106972_077290 [Dulcicalothrix desertica PCC 7102]|uniref:DUF4351 domain-containing protein n=1 Tax=Dulcicalothrix desertica PCC 7102 TaxID=232991 RepID=A0A433UZP2_9CYAN|nr:DUF4351 domain-containing protein [Dulcicalothrix desertica]RUS99287.1 hypothetical protein DSM106972_077290 [Dulcicalothrix desertica PCC 7102]TWH49953.1 putative transposase/invertase (TIGR01784 family) [Dulcicalothrix desertica PCC 7102]